MKIAVVCGTNREGSLSRLLSQEAADCYRQLGHNVDLIDMQELPAEALAPTSYKDPAPAVQAMVSRFLQSDGAVFVVPEYNGSYPGVLKLFVDMLPYPEGFDKRPCAFIGLAAGEFKGLRAVEHFQQVAAYRHAHLFPQRLFIGKSFQQFTDGKLSDGDLSKRLREQSSGFAAYIASLQHH